MNAALIEFAGMPQRFFQWWLEELTALLPVRLRHRLSSTGDRLVLQSMGNEIVVLRELGTELTSLGRFQPTSPGDPNDQFRSFLRNHGFDDAFLGRCEICVRLDSSKAAQREIQLPLIAEENLGEVITFELDRYTPFSAEQVYFSYRVVQRDVAAQRIRVKIALVPRAVVESIVGMTAALGLVPSRIDVAVDGGDYSALSGNLLPAGMSRPRASGWRVLRLALAGTAVVLAIIALYLPLARMQRAEDALARDFSAAKASATEAMSLRKDIDARTKAQRVLIDRKTHAPNVSKLLLETTHVLPDDTFLTAWALSNTEVQLEGTARSASRVVDLLEQSHWFQGTTFRSPVTREAGSGREHFRIATKIADENQP